MNEKIIDLPVQYSLFETKEQSEYRSLIEHVQKLEESCNRVRKSQFAKIGEQNKKIMDLENRLSILEFHLCKKSEL